ncbi:unnamed protein product [Owenia fusiformis]|uniref:Uncharacterized protein n=1 Tax=Owenia fusiformis TaxID=6347 RepID=A0A8J1TVF4_OWEFU|nr:unnamed protein product [Owenia fusiformis]
MKMLSIVFVVILGIGVRSALGGSIDGSEHTCVEVMDAIYSWTPKDTFKNYVDSTGRPGAGVMSGNTAWLGQFQQCQEDTDTQYCLAGNILSNNLSTAIKWGLCVPDTCTESILTEYIQKNSIPELFMTLMAGDVKTIDASSVKIVCAKDLPLSNGFYITIALCVILGVLAIKGTMLHYQKPHIDVPPRSNHVGSPWQQLGRTDRFLLCFSLRANGAKLFSSTTNEADIQPLHGIRVLTMMWIVLGHTFLGLYNTQIMDNNKHVVNIVYKWWFQPIYNAYFSVDTFFLLSGLLLSYHTLQHLHRTGGSFPVWKMYLHRYIRLTPLMAFTMFMWMFVLPETGSGPQWFILQDQTACQEYWWTNILYIENFYPTNPAYQCIGWTWYIATDFQLMLFSPILIFLIYKTYKWGCFMNNIFLVLSVCVTAGLIGWNNIDIDLTGTVIEGNHRAALTYEYVIFNKPYCRLVPYIIGILLGAKIQRKTQYKDYASRTVSRSGSELLWLVSALAAIATIWWFYFMSPLGPVGNVLYGSFCHPVYCLAVAWVIYATWNRPQSFISEFLSWRGWQPLGRLTYALYLVHGPVIFYIYISMQTTLHMSGVTLLILYSAILLLSYTLAILVTLTIEMPTVNLEKLIFSDPTYSKSRRPRESEEPCAKKD